MARRNPGDVPVIGKRWPYKALNFLPAGQLWKYLAWKSAPTGQEPDFRLGRDLTGCKRILIVLPDGFRENLIAFPVLQSLIQERPETEFLFVIDQALTGFLAAILGSDRVIGVRREEFHWGEPHFRELERVLAEFRPEVSLNLREATPPLLHYLVRMARAPIRVQLGDDAPAGFANVALKPSDPPNLLRRYLQIAKLWDVSERPVPVKWTRLAAGPENLKDAGNRIVSKGLRPEATRLFLWQDGNSQRERELFRECVAERSAQGEAQSLLVVNGAGPLFPTPPPPPDLLLGLPCLVVDSTGLMLGLFARARRCIGINGPLLHLASLADTDVEARFGEEDRKWDTSGMNGRMKVEYGA